mmetsp:Transcript_4598/g.5142  ORF Transcript_4598/g.5142 Transcript_4598/m.5142 type:complete len:131 (+) Transcript_4598:72-464(+)
MVTYGTSDSNNDTKVITGAGEGNTNFLRTLFAAGSLAMLLMLMMINSSTFLPLASSSSSAAVLKATPPGGIDPDKTKCALACAGKATGVFLTCAAACLEKGDSVSKCSQVVCPAAQLAYITACTLKCKDA